jgi:hypothetical protein
MNAKRKAPQEQTTGDDTAMQDANEALAAAAPADDGGTAGYNPDRPYVRPGQATATTERDDQTDRDYRAAQGGTFAGEAVNASGKLQATAKSSDHKPAEPTTESTADDIPKNALPVAKPAVEAAESGRTGGAGDPQNGVVITDATKSPIAWADTTRDVAQHYPPAEDGDGAKTTT